MTGPELRPRVERLEEDATAVADTVLDIKATVDGHTGTLGEHGAELAAIRRTLAEQDAEFAAIRQMLGGQAATLAEILRRLEPR